MKVSVIAAVGLAALTSAQSIKSLVAMLPSCALPCFVKYVPQVCPLTDYACQCVPANVSQLRKIITPCVVGACTQTEDLQVLGITNKICAAVSASGLASGGASSTSMAASSSASSSAAASSSPAASSSMASSSSAMSSSMSSAASMPASSSAAASSAMSSSMSSAGMTSASAIAPTTHSLKPSKGLNTGYTGAAAMPLATAAPMAGAGLAAAIAAFL